jgi:hypothetical protein
MLLTRVTWITLVGLAACQPGTTRPPFPPVPEAATTEIRLVPREATRLLAEALQADSLPARRVRLRDAYLESDWLDSAGGRHTRARPIGAHVVKLRAWADPTRPGFSRMTVETVYRPLADPSLPERELDRQVPREHPVAVKVRTALQEMVKKYGGPPAPEPAATPREAGDEVRGAPDEMPAEPQEETPPPDETPPDQSQP